MLTDDRYYSRRKRAIYIKRRRQLRNRMAAFLFTALFLSMALILIFSVKTRAQGRDETPASHKYYKCITVGSNDTLVSYAKDYSPDGDIESYVNEVMRMNQLTDDVINTGMNVIIPYYSEVPVY